MDKKQLEHLNCTKTEIRMITKEIEDFPYGLVVDYCYEYPNGQKRVKPIIGIADCIGVRHKLQAIVERLTEEMLKVEQFIESIDDPEIRVILRGKYIENKTYEKIGEEMGYEGSTVRKKHDRYWKDSHNSQE